MKDEVKAKAHDEYFIQRNYGDDQSKVWLNFGDLYYDLKTAKCRIKNLKGEFRIFKRTVTNWEEVKDGCK